MGGYYLLATVALLRRMRRAAFFLRAKSSLKRQVDRHTNRSMCAVKGQHEKHRHKSMCTSGIPFCCILVLSSSLGFESIPGNDFTELPACLNDLADEGEQLLLRKKRTRTNERELPCCILNIQM